MDFYDVVKNRKSVRSYKPDRVPEDVLLRVLEATRLAPSWANKQCWRYVIVDDPEVMARTSAMAKSFGAPMMVVVCGDPAESGQRDGKDYYLVDVAISMEHLVLAAAAEGLGTCWVAGRIDEAGLKRELGIPDNLHVVATTPLGFPSDGGIGGKTRDKAVRAAVGADSRKPVGEIAFRNKYGTPLVLPGK